MAHRRFTPHPLVLRRLIVTRVSDVTPRMRRVTLGGDEVGAFERDGLRHPAFASPMFDDHIKLLFATEGPVEPVLPVQLAHGIEWPVAPTRAGRDYTPRRVADGEIDLDFVMHADGDALGPAEAWARTATTGDVLWAVGPKSSTVLPDDVDAVVLIGDETALPAIGRFLEERPIAAPVHVVVTVADERAQQVLATNDGDSVTWVTAEPGDADALERAVGTLDAAVFASRPYVWAAAEARALLPIRRLLTREHGVPRSHVDITGYWHARTVDAASPTPADRGGPSVPRAPIDSPAAWFAVRAALQLGLFETVEGPGLPLGDVERRLRVPDGSLAPLVSVLVTRGYLTSGDAGVRLDEAGAELLADEHARDEFDGFEADQVLALQHLAPALRAARTPWEHRYGATVRTQAADDDLLRDELAEHAEGLAYLMPALIAAWPWRGHRTVTTHGPGAAVVADALRGAGAAADCTVTDEGAEIEIHAHALGHLTDAEARVHLSSATSSTLLLIESTRADALDPHAAERDLLRLAMTGTAVRSSDRLATLAAECGWNPDDVLELGWGVSCLVLHRQTDSAGGVRRP